jgi:predicted RND superfamily exporter protein
MANNDISNTAMILGVVAICCICFGLFTTIRGVDYTFFGLIIIGFGAVMLMAILTNRKK